MVAVLVVLTVVAFVAIDYWVTKRSEAAGALSLVPAAGFGELVPDLVQVPGDTFLAPGHTWLRLQPDGTTRIGVARLPLWALGRVDRLDLLPPGSELQAEGTLAELGRGARGLRLRSPVEGTVEAVNESLRSDPDRLRARPFDEGWLYTVRPRSLATSLKRMFVAEAAEAWLRRQIRLLRDFVAGLAAPQSHAPVLLDGGLPQEGFAVDLKNEQWLAVAERFFEHPEADA